MNEEIKKIIEKNLPAQVGDVLKQRLEQAEKDAVILKQQEEALISRNATIAGFEKQIAEYKKLDERNNKLEEREKAVETKERNSKVFEAELKATEAEKRANELFGFVGMVFKSPIFRKSTIDTTFGMMQWNSQKSQNEWIKNAPDSSIETKEID